MESKKLLFSVICLLVMITNFQVQAMSKVNTEFERYLRAMNSTTTIPYIEERIIIDNFIMAFLNYSYTNDAGIVVTYSDTKENARYGEGQILNVTGLLVHVSNVSDIRDNKACGADILGTLGNPFPTDQPWIALVQRGKCNFEDKVKHVAQKGAVGVIVFNDKPVIKLEKMQIKDKNRNITAVMTYQEIGQDMATILDQGFQVVASINKGSSRDQPIGMLNEASMLFVSISFIVLLIISVVWLIFYYIQRFRYIQSKDQQSRHLSSVTKRAIMKIPTKTGKGIGKDGDNDCCAVCIETYKSSDCIRILPCKHEFHKNCIDPWLIEHRTCPMCKLDVLKYYGYVIFGSEESIMEFNNSSSVVNTNLPEVLSQSPPNMDSVTLEIEHLEGRLRNFNINTPPMVYRHQLLERTQSFMSLDYNKKMDCSMTNKLGEQQAIVQVMQISQTEENMRLADTLKKRRSSSADGRFSQDCTRREVYGRLAMHKIKIPSTSTGFRQNNECTMLVPDVKIQINGEGVVI